MKQGIHPTTNPVIFKDTSSGVEFVTTSVLSSGETRDIDGVPHSVISIEISSASHPFYTGKQMFVDAARRVEKFEQKLELVKKASAERKTRRVKHAAKAGVRAKKGEGSDDGK